MLNWAMEEIKRRCTFDLQQKGMVSSLWKQNRRLSLSGHQKNVPSTKLSRTVIITRVSDSYGPRCLRLLSAVIGITALLPMLCFLNCYFTKCNLLHRVHFWICRLSFIKKCWSKGYVRLKSGHTVFLFCENN